MVNGRDERQAVPARAGFGGKSHQMLSPPLGLMRATARTCPVRLSKIENSDHFSRKNPSVS